MVPKYVEKIYERVQQQPVVQVVEEIVEVPKVVYEEVIVEREVPTVATVQKYVEVPQIQERIKHVTKVGAADSGKDR